MKTFLVNNTGGDHPHQTNDNADMAKKGGKTMKKSLSLLLSLVLVLTYAASAFADASATATPEPTATVEPVTTTAPTATLEPTATPEPVITPEPTEEPLYSGASYLSAWEVYNLPLIGHKEKGAIEYLDGRWARARRAKNGDYLTWSINKMFQSERSLAEDESIVQTEADVVDFNLKTDLYGSVSFRLDPEALTCQIDEKGKLQDKTPYENALTSIPDAILAAFVSLNEAYRGESLLVEYISTIDGQYLIDGNDNVGLYDLTLHKLALRGGPTIDNDPNSWIGNFGFEYLDPSKDDRDQENSWLELPPSFSYIVRVSGNLAAIDWINVGILKPYEGQKNDIDSEFDLDSAVVLEEEQVAEPTEELEPVTTPEPTFEEEVVG